MSAPSIPFIDLGAQRARLGTRLDDAIRRVVDHGAYVMGPEVLELEKQLAELCGASHCISCSSGTDALIMVLMAWGVGPGDAVLVPDFTFVATAEAAVLLGASVVFVDVAADSFCMDPDSLEAGIALARDRGLEPKVVIPVDLFGQPADYPRLQPICDREGLRLLADGAQSFGASLHGKRVGAFGDATTTSFFPAKPLGCYGDGGAIFTDDAELADLLRSVRVHGEGRHKYENVRVGINGRLDTIQAAVLLEKLTIFEDELRRRQVCADRYSQALDADVTVPRLSEGATSAWAQYTVRLEEREAVQGHLKAAGVPSGIYYVTPLSQQKGYSAGLVAPGGNPIAASLSERVLSLPMHPYLEPEVQDRIVAALREALRA